MHSPPPQCLQGGARSPLFSSLQFCVDSIWRKGMVPLKTVWKEGSGGTAGRRLAAVGPRPLCRAEAP